MKSIETDTRVFFSRRKYLGTNKIIFFRRSGLSSEVSDEDSEIWARIMDLPGFDDNVSQNNVIVYLLRINIVQVGAVVNTIYR